MVLGVCAHASPSFQNMFADVVWDVFVGEVLGRHSLAVGNSDQD